MSHRRPTVPLAIRLLACLCLSLALTACGEDETPAPASDADAPAAADPQAQAAVAEASQKFAALMEHGGETTPILGETRQLVERYPTSAAARTLLAQVLLVRGQLEEAYEQLERSLTLDPRQPEARLLAGTIALQRGDATAAQRHYSEAIGLEPGEPRYRMHLAQAYLAQHQHDQARDALRDALVLDSSLHTAHAALADVYAEQGKVSLALEQIRRARDLLGTADEDRRVVYARRYAALLRRDNQPGEALRVLLELPPKRHFDPGVMQDLARTWMMLGQPERAAGHYEQALVLDPSNDAAAAAAAHWHLEAGQVDAARQAIARLRQINPRAETLPQLEARLREAAATP